MNTPLIVMFTIAGLVVFATWLFGRDKTSTSPTATSTPSAPSPATTPTPSSKMSAKSIRSWKNQLTDPFSGLLLVGILGICWFFFGSVYRLWQWITNLIANFHISGLKPGLWSAIIVSLIILTIVGVLEFRGRDKNNSGVQEHWKKMRKHFYFGVLWTVIVAVLNVGLYQLDANIWWGLWKFKGEGTWFFWLIQTLLVVGMVLAVNQPEDAKSLRNCGKILVAFSLVFWTWAWAKSDGRPPGPITNTTPAVTIVKPVIMEDKVIPLEKGEWSQIYDPALIVDVTGGGKKRVAQVYGDNVPREPITYPDGKHVTLPEGTKRVKFKSDESALQLIVRVVKSS